MPNGTVRIIRRENGSYAVTWAPYPVPGGQDGGALKPPQEFADERRLKEFLVGILGIDDDLVAEGLKAVRTMQSAVIPNVSVSAENVERYGLGLAPPSTGKGGG